MTPYHFAAQYQQNPQPPLGNLVQREWLKFYTPEEKPEAFGTILQSWDTAVRDTELANFSVCTTWGIQSGKAYLLDVFRRKLAFPALKKSVEDQAKLHDATVVLIEYMSSGAQLIQQLHFDGFSKATPAPSLEGNKIMRLNGQTPMIEGGFVLFPKQADWLESYLSELLSFPSSHYDDQVDSTVYALAWIGANPQYAGTLIKKSSMHYYTDLPQDLRHSRVFSSWDTALKDGGQGDWTVCTVWLLHNGIYYLRHMERGLYGHSELRKKFVELNKQYVPFKILFEETTIGKSLKHDRNLAGSYRIKLVPVELDRVSRVYVLQSMFEEGRVRFPKDAPFMDYLERELLSYPHGRTSDIVDSIALALTVGASGYDSTLAWVADV